MARVTLTRSGGGDPSRTLDRMADSGPTRGDILAMAVFHHGITLDRTERGLNVDEVPFAPYSDIGPVYIDVGAKVGPGRTIKQRISATQRLARKVGHPAQVFKGRGPLQRAQVRAKRSADDAQKRSDDAGPRFRRIASVTPIGGITPSGLLKAASYAWFKLTFLGRRGVDLIGHRAPHMLQGLLVSAGGSLSKPRTPDVRAMTGPARPVEMGLFGEEAARGRGHNEGAGPLPRRKWLGFGRGDAARLAELVGKRIVARVSGRTR